MGYGAHGAGVADSEGHARNQTEPTQENSSVYCQISAVQKRRVARRQIQRARRKEFSQQRSASTEGRIAQLESQVAILLDQILSLQLQVDGQTSDVATCMAGTQTCGDKADQRSAATHGQTEAVNRSECAAQASEEFQDAVTQLNTNSSTSANDDEGNTDEFGNDRESSAFSSNPDSSSQSIRMHVQRKRARNFKMQ